jgi:putative mRNA 3-end processing factor
MLRTTDRGLYCDAGDFFVDPWQPVDRAVITHAHGDHARAGHGSYLCTARTAALIRHRFDQRASIEEITYGEARRVGNVVVTLHPAGHVLGSAQVLIEGAGGRWLFTGDYKHAADPTCEPYELVRCDTLVTEATFALPIYRWQPAGEVCDEIAAWWSALHEAGEVAILFGYTLGKSQRLLAELGARGVGPIVVHGAVDGINRIYRAEGIPLPAAPKVVDTQRSALRGSLVLAPPSAQSPGWMRRFGTLETGFASGWMRIRGTRRSRAIDRGFAISDHVDWPALLATIDGSGATRVLATHGDSRALVRFLQESRGLDAGELSTAFVGEGDGEAPTDRGEESPSEPVGSGDES